MSVPRENVADVTLLMLQREMKDGEIVTPKLLLEQGVIKKTGRSIPTVKLIGSWGLTKKLFIKGCKTSAGARLAIEKAGGNVTNNQ